MAVVAITLLLLSATWWLVQLGATSRSVQRVQRFAAGAPAAGARGRLPRLSVIVPARDEAAGLKATLTAKLSSAYPDWELVLVDDQSTDATRAIASELARDDSRLKVVSIDSPRPGWLGKVNALETGRLAASGDWLLFCDADVAFEPFALEQAIGYALAERLDQLAVLPRVWPKGATLTLALFACYRLVAVMSRPWAVPAADSSAAFGLGAFNLVRRAAFEQTAGFEGLRLEVTHDFELGRMMKRGGFRCAVAAAPYHVRLAAYPSFGAMARAFERYGLAAPLAKTLLVGIALVCAELGWLPALFLHDQRVMRAVVVVVVTAYAASHMVTRWLRLPAWPALFPGFGALLLVGITIRAAWLARRRGGILWRGAFHSQAELSQGSGFASKPPDRS